MDSIGSEVDDEINATAEVRAGYNDIFLLFFFSCFCLSRLWRKLLNVFFITNHCKFKYTGRTLKRP